MQITEEEPKEPYTYVNIVVEIKLNPTETREKLEEILNKFISGDIEIDKRFDGTYLLIQASGIDNLLIFHEWISTQKIIDTVRSRLFRSMVGNITALYFNRAAAYMDHLSLVDADDNIPLGPLILQIVSDNLEQVIDEIAPKTFEGRIVSAEEQQRILARREKIKKRKQKDRERTQKRDEKYLKEF